PVWGSSPYRLVTEFRPRRASRAGFHEATAQAAPTLALEGFHFPRPAGQITMSARMMQTRYHSAIPVAGSMIASHLFILVQLSTASSQSLRSTFGAGHSISCNDKCILDAVGIYRQFFNILGIFLDVFGIGSRHKPIENSDDCQGDVTDAHQEITEAHQILEHHGMPSFGNGGSLPLRETSNRIMRLLSPIILLPKSSIRLSAFR